MERKEREKVVFRRMSEIFCHKKHGSVRGSLCRDCEELLAYSCQRVERCPMGDKKVSCRKCPIHCYAPAEREKVRIMMRYVGPRMLRYYPLTAIRHLLSEL